MAGRPRTGGRSVAFGRKDPNSSGDDEPMDPPNPPPRATSLSTQFCCCGQHIRGSSVRRSRAHESESMAVAMRDRHSEEQSGRATVGATESLAKQPETEFA